MFNFYSRLSDLFKRINVEKSDNGDYIAKDELTNLSAYGNSVEDAIKSLIKEYKNGSLKDNKKFHTVAWLKKKKII